MTAYNAEATVIRALASALNQDWPTLEILVVDDASTDGTVALVESFIREHATEARPIRLLRQPSNGGVARARNRLVEEARGEFIAFFDDDDVSAPDRVSRQHARIAETEAALGHDLVLCHTARLQEFPDGHLHYEATMGCEHQVVPFGPAVADRILLGRLSAGVIGSCATCSQMGRTSVYRRLGGFDPTLPRSEDTDLNIRCAYHGGAFAGLAAPLVLQTMTPGAEKNLAAELEAHAALQAKHRDYLSRRGWLEFSLEWQEVRRLHLRRSMGPVLGRAALLAITHPMKFIRKIYWSLPAHRTRRQQRRWQQPQ
jgi:glycosyltransferase involved in cell wall biosynthesis